MLYVLGERRSGIVLEIVVLKVRQMRHYVMFSLCVLPYQPILDFGFFILEWTIIVKRIWYCIKKTSFQTTQEGH